jgi:predicted CopG family antitoxin
MGSTTISLEKSAYERLRQAKRPGESFSGVVRRLTEKSQPSLSRLAGWFDRETADALARTISELRSGDSSPPRGLPRRRGVGSRTRH